MRGIGALQMLIAIMLMFGDQLGGTLLLAYLALSVLAVFGQ